MIGRTYRRLVKSVSYPFVKRRDLRRPTLVFPEGLLTLSLHRRFGFVGSGFMLQLADSFPLYPDLVREQAQQAVDHRFNLLGSGWVTVAHGMQCHGLHGIVYPSSPRISADPDGAWLRGRINKANLAQAQAVWRLVDVGYVPIDWQIDFKSGYRWRENEWYRDVRFGHSPGMDIKVPWELSRMQHLPTLALAAHFSEAGLKGFHDSDTYAREFKNQVLDFISTNPPRFGVNWVCAMDVAIRITNILVAHDLLIAAGKRLDDKFERVLHASVVAHVRHILGNLEWTPRFRGNHYLANIVGLLFAASYLPRDDEVDAWLAFAVQELITEVGYQFHEDGSNFEASVCYHRLSSEMVIWAFSLLANLPEDKRDALMRYQHRRLGVRPPLRPGPLSMHPIPGNNRTCPVPGWCWNRLSNMASFTAALTKPDGLVVQFGDNDSGRFITAGSGEQLRAANDPRNPAWSLDHQALIAAIDALVHPGTDQPRAPPDVTTRLIAGLAGVRVSGAQSTAASERVAAVTGFADEKVWQDLHHRFHVARDGSRWTTSFPARSSELRHSLLYAAFPGMGCFIFRSAVLYLAVRCGEIGLSGLGAHAHCDQLGIELVIDGRNLVRDPGSYLYTPFADHRNAYRSVSAHHAPRVPGREPGDLTRGTFDMRGTSAGECLYFGPRGFIGRHDGYGAWIYRIVAIEDEGVVVRDFAEDGLQVADPTPVPLAFSPGYGILATMQSTD